jgi:hypothetical protein
MRSAVASFALVQLLMSCASTSAPTSASSPADAAELLAAAVAAHHCAGEDADDDARAAALAACIDTNTARARALLPAVKAAQALSPGPLAAVRLFLDDVSSAERGDVCQALPAGDFLDSLLDDEAHAICGN